MQAIAARYWKVSCPYCKHRITLTVLDPSQIRIGSDTTTCPNCKKEFSTGKKEWNDMSEYDKKEFLNQDWKQALFIIGIIGVFAIMAGISDGDAKASIN